jgi:two-component system, cell cycle response regulator
MIRNVMFVNGGGAGLEYIETAVSKAGLHISEVHDANEAVDLIKNDTRPDLVITDFSSDKKSGDLVDRIRKLPGCEFMPIVMLSAGPRHS